MEEKELISQIKKLKSIKPNSNWVALNKAQILGDETRSSWVSILEFFPGMLYRHSRLAFASLIAFSFVAGTFGFAQGALPGDPIYTLKRVTEKAQMAFISEGDLPYVQLELAQKRLAELNIIAQTNQTKKIAPAVQEFQASISQVAKNLNKTENLNIAKIVADTKKLQEDKEKIESLGVIIGESEDLNNALAGLVGRELIEFGSRTLGENQQAILMASAQDYWNKNYSAALEKILLLGN